jgi:hypothetical protein
LVGFSLASFPTSQNFAKSFMVKKDRFYVYAFLRVDKTPYYVGKGSGWRAYSNHRVIKRPKDKSRIVFLRKGLTEDKAFEWERFYIKHYGRIDLSTGILRNLTDGGEGQTGRMASEEVKKVLKGNHKAREASKLKRQKAIELTRMSDGAVFVYECISDAARAFNLNRGALSSVCYGKRYSTGGFLARYWSPDLHDQGEGLSWKIEEVRKKHESRAKRVGKILKLKNSRPVELKRVTDGEVFIFESGRDACRVLNLNPGALSRVCHGEQKSHKGFTARYLDAEQG